MPRPKKVVIARPSTAEETVRVFGVGKRRLRKIQKMVDEVVASERKPGAEGDEVGRRSRLVRRTSRDEGP